MPATQADDRRWLAPWVDEEWKLRAACRGMDPDLWFPSEIGRRHYARTVAALTERAKAVCKDCPVRWRCLDYARVTDQSWGIWGGLTEEERARL